MNSRRPASAQWRSLNTRMTGSTSAIRWKNVRQAANSSSRCPGGISARPSSPARRGSIQRRSSASGNHWSSVALSLVAGAVGRLRLGDPGPLADHLGQGPIADALAIRRRAAGVPVGGLGHAIDVLLELPAEPALADAPLADDRHQARLALAHRGVEQVLDESISSSRPTNGGSSAPRRRAPPRMPTHLDRAPRGDRRGLALQQLLAGLFIRNGSPVARFVASPTSTVPGGAAPWRRLAVFTRSPAMIP